MNQMQIYLIEDKSRKEEILKAASEILRATEVVKIFYHPNLDSRKALRLAEFLETVSIIEILATFYYNSSQNGCLSEIMELHTVRSIMTIPTYRYYSTDRIFPKAKVLLNILSTKLRLHLKGIS